MQLLLNAWPKYQLIFPGSGKSAPTLGYHHFYNLHYDENNCQSGPLAMDAPVGRFLIPTANTGIEGGPSYLHVNVV